MDAEPILVVDDLRRHFGGIRAVDGATLRVGRGTVTGLIGPNGAGKTSLFNLLTGFYRPDGGRVTYDGHDVTNRSTPARCRLGLARTFQLTKALSAMSVLDNVMLAAPHQPGEHLWRQIVQPRRCRRREREVREQALATLAVFDLADKADEYAGTLSGGQRKLLELARALVTEPRLVLLDEPMAGINPSLGRRLLDHMQRLRAEHGTTFLLIEHDMDAVMRHADRVIVMAQGRVIADAPPEEIQRDPVVIDAYLGAGA